MVLSDRRLLVRDIHDYLTRYRPGICAAYPAGYFRWVIGDSLDIAKGFSIDDVQMLRVFVRLRWDIAPGFYKQPDIAAVLSDVGRPARERFDALQSDRYADAWEDACRYDSPDEWRERFWQDEP
ncbi:hypothetical protein [Azospirillum sp. B2RO_4]|uniref:hypothetical protein n=1 Tax=Azospirillum sp. B2RO_4 TaxID=3027796 RepID=UPI003DA9AC52